jgi:hypothetical protein
VTPADWTSAVGGTLSAAVTALGPEGDSLRARLTTGAARVGTSFIAAGAVGLASSRGGANSLARNEYIDNAIGQEVGQFIGGYTEDELNELFTPSKPQPSQGKSDGLHYVDGLGMVDANGNPAMDSMAYGSSSGGPIPTYDEVMAAQKHGLNLSLDEEALAEGWASMEEIKRNGGKLSNLEDMLGEYDAEIGRGMLAENDAYEDYDMRQRRITRELAQAAYNGALTKTQKRADYGKSVHARSGAPIDMLPSAHEKPTYTGPSVDLPVVDNSISTYNKKFFTLTLPPDELAGNDLLEYLAYSTAYGIKSNILKVANAWARTPELRLDSEGNLQQYVRRDHTDAVPAFVELGLMGTTPFVEMAPSTGFNSALLKRMFSTAETTEAGFATLAPSRALWSDLKLPGPLETTVMDPVKLQNNIGNLTLFRMMSALPGEGPILFGQKAVSPEFSSAGAFKGAPLESVAEDLQAGLLSPDSVRVNYINWNGERAVINNRSLTTLSKAGFTPTNTADVTTELSLNPKNPDNLFAVVERLREMNYEPSYQIGVRPPNSSWTTPPSYYVDLAGTQNWGIGPLRPPAFTPGANEGVLLTESFGLQSSRSELFRDVQLGEHGDRATTYLWTIDSRGINLAPEPMAFPTKRGNIVHTNLSSEAATGGEAWFGPNNTVTINANSGRFGYHAGMSQQQWDNAAKLWRSLGYIVNPRPLGVK